MIPNAPCLLARLLAPITCANLDVYMTLQMVAQRDRTFILPEGGWMHARCMRIVYTMQQLLDLLDIELRIWVAVLSNLSSSRDVSRLPVFRRVAFVLLRLSLLILAIQLSLMVLVSKVDDILKEVLERTCVSSKPTSRSICVVRTQPTDTHTHS
jgi:hypothetical protein|eukprot:COSAG06_NODE_3533_length_5218_cov_616.271147_6_plen_154_part_00